MNSDKLFEQIYERMKEKSTDELLTIWHENDRGLWSDMAFAAVKEVLLHRNIQLPVQDKAKTAILQSQILAGKWEWLHFSWVFYILFLLWVAILHPFLFIGSSFTLNIVNPLHPSPFTSIESLVNIQDMKLFLAIWKLLVYFELGIVYCGIYSGYLLVKGKNHALFWAKYYCLSLCLWIIFAFFFFHFYVIVESILHSMSSVIPFDWKTLLVEIFSKIKLEFSWRGLGESIVPASCALVWFTFFAKSKWMAKRTNSETS